MKRHFWVLAVIGAASCTPYSVSTDYDTEADFSKLRTYAWHTASGDVPAVDSLTQKRIVRAVDDALAARGYRKDEGNPDFKVFTLASINQRISSQPVTTAYGYGWRHGYAFEGTEVTSYDEGTLVVDIISPGTKSLLWRGKARATIDPDRTPEEREERIRGAAFKILELFPPPKAK